MKDTVIGVLLTALIFGAGFFLLQLDRKIDAQSNAINLQSEKITALEKNLAVLVAILNTKMPNTNWSALMTMSAKKNISQEQLTQLIPMIERDPAQAKAYLENQLHLDSKEADMLLKPTATPNKNPAEDNPLKN